ncbi:tryptophan-rich sensory protein [Flavihumibacter fluvii]|uniref:tryptophan-rich sensory protein n=1 Tax=Flavihumibacter fluvii TaxID=2838157 RepID=UPI001BDF4D10|nr:tryptophan-rich sensory protein [Flavihumibacter fluvii]ULQ52238.1 tryptophan-rich sensory protein [Flavihumibacter fluvii]
MSSTSIKRWSVLNMMAFAAVIAVNTLAITLPINGMDTGKISDLYPNLFVPAGFTFSIWSVIYLLLLFFCVYCLKVAFGRNKRPVPIQAVEAVSPLFFISCLLNISWIMLWHYLQIGLSVFVMVLFLLTLILAYLRLLPYINSLNLVEMICIRLPFSVYLGWISVATVANFTALLVHMDWNGFGLDDANWSTLMISVATLLGTIFLYKWKELAYGLVITWALFGIYSKQINTSSLVGYAAITGMAILVFGLLIAAYRSIETRRANH